MDAELPEGDDNLQKTLGLDHIIEMDGKTGRAVMAYRAGMHMCHSGGVVQGGFVTGWIDAAMAHALIATLEPGSNFLSYEIKVSFYKSAGPGLNIAEGRVDLKGRSTAFLEGELRNEAGEILAKATSTAKILRPKT